MSNAIEKAKAAHKAAAEAIIEAVKKEYPIGEVLPVKLGGHVLTIKVTGHSNCWWQSPGEMHGENIATGKVRRFHHGDVCA